MPVADNSHLDLDTRLLSEFLYALNIARRQVLAYPAGHPVIGTATRKLLDLLPRLLEFRSEITIGIARDTLLVGNQVLDANNPVYRDLAQNLFDAKVASLTINNRLTEADICRFFEIFRHQPEQLADAGGLSKVLLSAGIQGVRAQGVDFNAFRTTEAEQIRAPKAALVDNESAALWKSFVGGLINGNLDPDGEALPLTGEMDPDLLADLLNDQRFAAEGQVELSYEEAITTFLKQTDYEQIRSQACQETLGRLGEMVGRLKPELRRRFLNSTLKACTHSHEAAVLVLEKVPQHAILDAMENIDPAQMQIPQTLMDVLGKLARHRGQDVSHSRVTGDSQRTFEETTEHLSRLFSPDNAQFFVPRDYQDALAMLAMADVQCGLDQEKVNDLVSSLDGHKIERQFSRVLLDILDHDPEPETCDAIGRNLKDLVEYFLETGDFQSLVNVHDHLKRQVLKDNNDEEGPAGEAFEMFADPEFVRRVLDGIDLWGKPAHAAIKVLIRRVGEPFSGPLLERLAEETDMSRRRFYLECLQMIGVAARDAIIARLHDRRWYFVRNLVILLRDMSDPSVLGPLGRLVGYEHPKVQFEVMRTFLHYNDPRADRYLLQELRNSNPAVLLNAVKLAAGSQNPAVAARLGELLNMRFSPDNEDLLKTSILQAIGESARNEALPGLAQFLSNRGLLKFKRPSHLKVIAAGLLEKFESPEAGRIAAEVYRQASGELARVAGKVCLQHNGRLP